MRTRIWLGAGAVGTVTSVCAAGLVAFLFALPSGARLLADAELQEYLGGGCNDSQMTTVPCTNPNNDCLNTSILCVSLKGKGVCWRWEPNPQGTCTGMKGWNCTCTSQSEGCARQYEGPMASGWCPNGCEQPRGTCGIVETNCTSGPCDPKD